MKPLRNSVWKNIEEVHILIPERFRILEVYPDISLVVLFPIHTSIRKITKPQALNLNELTTIIQGSRIIEDDFDYPGFLTLSDSELEKSWQETRDNHYEMIQPLIEDPFFLYRMSIALRSKEIMNRSRELSVSHTTLYRLLNRYWHYGQVKNSLAPFYLNCGLKAKQKNASHKKRGRPVKSSILGFETQTGINISEEDKINIRQGIEKHYEEGKQPSKSAVWSTVLTYYADEIFCAEQENRDAEIPNYRQFCYWMPFLVDEIKLEKQRLGETFWEMNHRALLGSVSENVHAPGDRFEIDSTIADVYIVSEVDRNRVLGRPVIYVVVDEASRMLAGLHVSIYWASLTEAKQALLNAFLPKEEYCKSYGLDFNNQDWPCAHVPRGLLVDRAELIGDSAAEYTTAMGIQIEICQAFRGDWKGIVERRFGIANVESLHDLKGTTRGQIRKRGEKPPPDDAFYTLREITTLLIQLFVDGNKTMQLDCLITKDIIKENLAPTPINSWDWSVQHHRDSLSTVEPDQARAELLPCAKATVTGRGIECNGLWYTCDEGERDNWFVLARKNGSWRLSARIDNNSSVIWIRPEKGRNLICCNLLKRDSLYANLTPTDVIYIQEWKKNKKNKPGRLAAKVRYSQLKESIDENVKKEIRENPSKSKKQNKGAEIRSNRKEEQERILKESNSKNSHEELDTSRTVNPDDHFLSLMREACSDDESNT